MMSDMRYKVNEDMKSALLATGDMASVGELAQICLRIDQNLQNLRRSQARLNNRSNVASSRERSVATTRTLTSGVTTPIPTPSQNSTSSTYRLPTTTTTSEEKVQLFKEGKCYKCKQPGHRFFDCPTRKARVQEVQAAPIEGQGESGNEGPWA